MASDVIEIWLSLGRLKRDHALGSVRPAYPGGGPNIKMQLLWACGTPHANFEEGTNGAETQDWSQPSFNFMQLSPR